MKRANWHPTDYTTICSEHFHQDCFVPGLKYRRLKPSAIPTIFEGFPEHLQPKKSAPRRVLKRVARSDEKENVVAPVTEVLPEEAVKKDHDYCPSPKKLKLLLDEEKTRNEELKKKLKSCQRSNQRLKEQVGNLGDVVARQKSRRLLGENAIETLQKCASEVPTALFSRLSKRLGGSSAREVYPPSLKNFALTLHFHSPKAYRYVRKMFELSLPHESVLRKWCAKVDGSPGFTDQSFKQLAAKVADQKEKNREVVVELVTDEMAIMKKTEFDGQKFVGCVDLGNGPQAEETSTPASEAFVIMAVALNASWKLPLAYFLISSLSGGEKASLVDTCANKLRDVGVHIAGMTCDGPAVNLSMLSHLGAKLDPENLVPDIFPSAYPNEPVRAILDTCHAIKLVRNAFADLGIFKNAGGSEIKWDYVRKLHQLQSREGLHAANKIRKSHVEFHKQKMKVALATQVLSQSVADALRFCRTELNLPEFQGSQATEEFIEVFNELFDVLNSKNFLGRGKKAPMQLSNEDSWSKVFQRSRQYISGLRLLDGTRLIHSKRKTGLVGFLINMKSVENIFDRFVRTNRLKYLLTYKLSQDHLELFFGCVRSRLGCNNNPTAKQFQSTYRRLLIHGVTHGLNGNCLPQDDTELLADTTQSSPQEETDSDISKNVKQYNLEDQAECDHDYIKALTRITELSPFQNSVMEYIGGFAVKKALQRIKCETCCLSIAKQPTEKINKLVNVKDKGGLIRISRDVKKICEATELCLQRMAYTCSGRVPLAPKILLAVSSAVLKSVAEKHS